MSITLRHASVGPWPMNTYVVIDDATQTAAVIDPGADPDMILALAGPAAIAVTEPRPDGGLPIPAGKGEAAEASGRKAA